MGTMTRYRLAIKTINTCGTCGLSRSAHGDTAIDHAFVMERYVMTLEKLKAEAREVAENYINGNITDALHAICSHNTNNRGESALLAIKVLANLDAEDRKRFIACLERSLY